MAKAYLTPRGFLYGSAAMDAVAGGWAWPMPGGAFAAAEISRPAGGVRERRLISRPAYDAGGRGLTPELDRGLQAIAAPRGDFAGLPLAQPILMGVVNATPDSFSDGGSFATEDAAVAHGIALAEAGAAIIDVGGESTRPGAAAVSPSEEIARTQNVIKALAQRGLMVSIDSRNASVMAAALAAGAAIVNDISALRDPAALAVVAGSRAAVVLMHMQGEPRDMQVNPVYAWAPGDIYDSLQGRIDACRAAGISPGRIAVDPGLGFGKTAGHNAEILNHLALFHGLGCALALGASRKSFIGRASRGEEPDARLPGSLACALYAADHGAHILRVHDVAETRQALAVRAAMA